MTAPVVAGMLAEDAYDEWTALVDSSPQGSPYSTPAYLSALCAATGGTFRILGVRKGDDLAGGVALYEQRDERGMRVAPRPLLYYNGIVLRDTPTKYPSQRTARLLETTQAVESAIAAMGHASVTLKSRSTFTDARSFLGQGWNARPGYTYVVALGDLQLAWERVEQNLRRLVNRASQNGLHVTEDEDFASFFRMHEAQAGRKGTGLYLPAASFGAFFTALRARGLCRLYHARLPTGQSISAQLVLTGKHPVSHSVAAAADPAYLNSGATAFLRWTVFERLAALGYAANDLTDAALNSVAHFKSQLGGDLELCLILERPAPRRTLSERLRSAARRYLAPARR